MSRLHHRDDSFQDGSRFAESWARPATPPAGAPQPLGGGSGAHLARGDHRLRAWPSSSSPVASVARRLPDGRSGPAARAEGAVRGWTRRRRSSRPGLDELVDAAVAGMRTAREWQELGWHLSAAPLGLPAEQQVWEALVRPDREPLAAVGQRGLPPAQQRRHDDGDDPACPGLHGRRHRDVHLPSRRPGGGQPARDARPPADPAGRTAGAGRHARTREAPWSTGSGVWLARQKMVRGELTAEETAELQMLVLRTWRSDAAVASDHLAELITDLPEGMRSALVEAAVEGGPAQAGLRRRARRGRPGAQGARVLAQ